MPDEKWGERPVALVVLREEHKSSTTPEDLKTFLEQFVAEGTISKWALPDRIYFVEEIPKTSVGKMDKKVIRQQLRDGNS